MSDGKSPVNPAQMAITLTVLVSEGHILRQLCMEHTALFKCEKEESYERFLILCTSFLGASVCLPCPAGQECPTAASTPENCPAGYVSALGESACTKCSNGK